MIKIAISSIAIFLLTFTVTGQTSEERAKLRDFLNLPASIMITQPDKANLPAESSLKVYIAAGQDKKAYKRFAKWVDQWNQGDGSKYGKLEIVSTISDADVILARYKKREFVPITRTTIGAGAKNDPTTDRNSTSPQIRTRTYLPIAQYSYLIAQTAGELVIVYDDVDRTHISEYSDPDKDLFNEFKKKLKSR